MIEFELGQIWINSFGPDQPGKIVAIEDEYVTIFDINRSTVHKVNKDDMFKYCELAPGYVAAKEFDEDLEKLINGN